MPASLVAFGFQVTSPTQSSNRHSREMKVSKYLGRTDSQLVSCRPRMTGETCHQFCIREEETEAGVQGVFVQTVKKGLEQHLTEGMGHGAQQPRRDTRRIKYSAFQELVLSAGARASTVSFCLFLCKSSLLSFLVSNVLQTSRQINGHSFQLTHTNTFFFKYCTCQLERCGVEGSVVMGTFHHLDLISP